MEKDSLGLIETLGLVGAIEAADAGSKAAKVSFRGYERGLAGLITVVFTGDVAAVQAAVAAGAAAAKRVGHLVSVHVIARPDRQVQLAQQGSEFVERRIVTQQPCAVPAQQPKLNLGDSVAPSTFAPRIQAAGISPDNGDTPAVTPAEPSAVAVAEADNGSLQEAQGWADAVSTGGNGHPPASGSSHTDTEEAVVSAPPLAVHKKEKLRKAKPRKKD